MPIINIYYKNPENEPSLQRLADKLKAYVAQELTCNERNLKPAEVSIRFLKVDGKMIGSVEVEITAHSFEERVKRQDEICLKVADYIKKEAPSLGEVKVWLVLAELGHSWKE